MGVANVTPLAIESILFTILFDVWLKLKLAAKNLKETMLKVL